ncbi:unnamed protein product [Dovyalis caffra]|uniref:Uncharacterized protein n=1 Tax=Dovyalis caffra TaxID=77055 RepID=A0AAV1S958_9ROSI|nr:unnamed protein product [Dovyalis caffra]
MSSESSSPYDLLCHEDFRGELAVADEDDAYIDITRTYVGDPDTGDEYLTLLANREPHRGFNANETLVLDSWLRNARLEAITWILSEDVFRCYILLRQLDVENIRTPNNVNSASRSSLVNGIARRRLTFDNDGPV